MSEQHFEQLRKVVLVRLPVLPCAREGHEVQRDSQAGGGEKLHLAGERGRVVAREEGHHHPQGGEHRRVRVATHVHKGHALAQVERIDAEVHELVHRNKRPGHEVEDAEPRNHRTSWLLLRGQSQPKRHDEGDKHYAYIEALVFEAAQAKDADCAPDDGCGIGGAEAITLLSL